jgi:hypothetical protein
MKKKEPIKQLTISISTVKYDMAIKIMRKLGLKTIDDAIAECIFSFWVELESSIDESELD